MTSHAGSGAATVTTTRKEAARGMEARVGLDPRLRRGPREGLLRREGRVRCGPRPQGQRRVSGRVAHASRIGVLDRDGDWDHRNASRLRPRPPAGRPGHRRGARRALGAGVDVSGREWKLGGGGDGNSFVFFSDPNGSGWVLQQTPGRERTIAKRMNLGKVGTRSRCRWMGSSPGPRATSGDSASSRSEK